MDTCPPGKFGPMAGVSKPKKFDCQYLEYYTQGRGRGLYPPGQGPPRMMIPNPSCGRSRGPYMSPFPALPRVGAVAQEAMEIDAPRRDQLPMGEAEAQAPVQTDVSRQKKLPNVGATFTRARQGPRKSYQTRVVRSSRPSSAAILNLRQERWERESCWATHGSLHRDKPDTNTQPSKKHCPEVGQFAVTLQPWIDARVVEGSY